MKKISLMLLLFTIFPAVSCDSSCRWTTTYYGYDTCIKKLAGHEGFYNTSQDGVRRVVDKLTTYKLVMHTENGCYDTMDIDENMNEKKVECPDFIPHSITLTKLKRCAVGYYDDNVDGCDAADSELYYSTDNDYFKNAVVTRWPWTDILTEEKAKNYLDFHSKSSDGKITLWTWHDYYYYLGTTLRLASFGWEEKDQDGNKVYKSIRVNAVLYRYK